VDCTDRDSGRLLQGYFDGELDLVRSLEFEDHLKTCPQCARELSEQQAIRQSLQGAKLYHRAPERLRARVLAAAPGETQPKMIFMPHRSRWQWLTAAAAFILLIFLGARFIRNIAGERASLADEVVSNHIRSLQPGHLFDVQSSDQHTVKPWFDGRLDFAPPVTDLASEGFPLVGGRLDYLGHRNVASLVYQRKKHLINVFVWPSGSGPSKLPEDQTIQGYNVVSWISDGMNFSAVSDLNSHELHQFVKLLQPNPAN
jgi:anti-sigma factor RsiW